MAAPRQRRERQVETEVQGHGRPVEQATKATCQTALRWLSVKEEPLLARCFLQLLAFEADACPHGKPHFYPHSAAERWTSGYDPPPRALPRLFPHNGQFLVSGHGTPRDEQPAVYRTRTVPRTRARLGPIFVVVARSHHENTRRGQNGSLRLECNTSAAFREGVRLGTIRPSSALHARFGTVDPVISVNGAVERKAHAMVLVLGLAYCLRTIHSSFM